jgi:hypothetical protein
VCLKETGGGHREDSVSGRADGTDPAPHSQRLQSDNFFKKWAATPGPYFILGSLVLAVITVAVGTAELKPSEEPNRLATSLLQAITLVFGTWGSYALGRDASREAAKAQVRQHAKSAFRRVLTLYGALGRFRDQAETEMAFLKEKQDVASGSVSVDIAQMCLDKFRLMSLEQIATGEDALEDWRDLAPDEVARIEAQATREAAKDQSNITEEIS